MPLLSSLSLLRRWFSIQNSQLVYQKKLKVSELAPGDMSRLVISSDALLFGDKQGAEDEFEALTASVV